jgi:hypothetical protein
MRNEDVAGGDRQPSVRSVRIAADVRVRLVRRVLLRRSEHHHPCLESLRLVQVHDPNGIAASRAERGIRRFSGKQNLDALHRVSHG